MMACSTRVVLQEVQQVQLLGSACSGPELQLQSTTQMKMFLQQGSDKGFHDGLLVGMRAADGDDFWEVLQWRLCMSHACWPDCRLVYLR